MANYTAEMLQGLREAYASGVFKVRNGDDWVEFQSMKQLRAAIIDIENDIKNGPRPSGTRLVSVGRGY